MSISVWLALALILLASHAHAIDPTRPPRVLAPAAAPGEAPPALHLQAIVRSQQVARAVINGQTLKVGEQLADARVLAIHPHSVLIEREGQRELLRLSAPVITPSRTTP